MAGLTETAKAAVTAAAEPLSGSIPSGSPAAELNASLWFSLIAEPLFGGQNFLLPESSRLPLWSILRSLSYDALTVLELPLQRPFPALPDISQRITRRDQVEHFLRSPDPRNDLDLLRRWHQSKNSNGSDEPGETLARTKSLWLELDTVRDPPSSTCPLPAPVYCIPLPNPCLDLIPWWCTVRQRAREDARDDPQALRLLAVAQTLRPPGRPMYLFDLSARRHGWIRLELVGVDHGRALDLLRRLHAPVPNWLEHLGPVAKTCEQAHLSFDIGPSGEIDDRIGWEVSFRRRPTLESRWLQLVDELGPQAVDPLAAELLSSWPSQINRSTTRRWPGQPAFKSGNFVRLISHIKLVGGHAQVHPFGKIYLICQFVKPGLVPA